MIEDIKHFKESKPSDTIAKIRQILHKNNITTLEKTWYTSIGNYHSLTLEVENTPFSVNGKGVTPSLALASAYGELMERIQNMTIFKLLYDFSQDDITRHDFKFSPDEIELDYKGFLQNNNPWLSSQTSDKNEGLVESLLIKWQSVSMTMAKDKFICLPFFHVNSEKVNYIPLIMLSKMYTSNGMAAGNTMQEAIVQGISEIYERYAIKQIIKENLTPPLIPYSEIKRCDLLHHMVQSIESNNRYKLHFSDCSLGIGLPVVAVTCVDLHSGEYFVKFGSHPIFEIAIERTLTELFQGQNIDEMKLMRYYSHNIEKACSNDNIYGIFINGSGDYPSSFFKSIGSYKHIPFESNESRSNHDLMYTMISDIKQRDWDIFIRDVSFLGFPSCQIIISGISEVEAFDDEFSIERYANFCDIKTQLQNAHQLSNTELCELANSIDKRYDLTNSPPTDWLHQDEKSSSWIYKNTYWLITALYILAGDIEKSAKTMTSFLNEYTMFNKGHKSSYFNCAVAYLTMKSEKMNPDDIFDILTFFYTDQMIENIINDFSKERLYSCINNGKFSAEKSKVYYLELLYTKLKDVYEINAINQSELTNVFESTRLE